MSARGVRRAVSRDAPGPSHGTKDTCPMRVFATAPVIVILGQALIGSALAADSAHERLSQGEVLIEVVKVEGSSMPRFTAQAVLDATPEQVWTVIDHCADYRKTMVRIRASEELSREGGVVRCRVTVDMPFPLTDLTAVTEAVRSVVPGQRYERRWNLVEGDYVSNSGSWTLTPFDAEGRRTLAVYDMHAEPKIAVPDWLQRKAQRKSMRDLFEKLRAVVRARNPG
jgi:hypothetical protein